MKERHFVTNLYIILLGFFIQKEILTHEALVDIVHHPLLHS